MHLQKSVLFLTGIAVLTATVGAAGLKRSFQAELRGRNENPLTLSAGQGHLDLIVDDTDTSVHFVLKYSGLETTVGAAHIHVGQPTANGGVTVFFCGTVPAGFPARPACPQEGTVEGDFTSADVIGLPSQQLDKGDLATLLAAIRAGKTYANVHTATSPAGEIRGQIRGDEGDEQ